MSNIDDAFDVYQSEQLTKEVNRCRHEWHDPHGYQDVSSAIEYIALLEESLQQNIREKNQYLNDWRGLRDAIYGIENCQIANRSVVERTANELREEILKIRTTWTPPEDSQE